MVEPQPWHGEILPGYVKYFNDLGYEVDLIVRYANYSISPFVRMPHKPQIFCMTLWGMIRALRSKTACNYEYIFLSSDKVYLLEYCFWGRFADLVGFIPKGTKGGSLVEHDLPKSYEQMTGYSHNQEKMKEYFNSVFALTGFEFNGKHIPTLNPHYFGEWKKKPSSRKRFVIIGRISAQVRDFNSFLASLKKMSSEYDFEVMVAGRADDPSLIKDLPENVKYLGFLDFEQLYSLMESADYILPLLSTEVEAHKHYLYSCSSGTPQLSYGFHVPMIIQKDFALHYGFDQSSAILYQQDSDLNTAIKDALLQSKETHEKMCFAVAEKAKKIYDLSLDNLRNKIK